MSFRFIQIPGGDMSLSGEPSLTIRYKGVGQPDFIPGIDFFSYVGSLALAQVAVTTNLHPQGPLHRQSIQIHENKYARSYDLTVAYGLKQNDVGAYQITVDQTGGTVHVTAGRRIAGFGLAADEVDNGGLIGVNGDDVEGVDIPVDQSKITVNFRHPQGVLNFAYVYGLEEIVGYPNADTFLGRAPGEVLFKGGSFTETNTEATAQYNFDISRNRTGLTIGDIAGVSKKGWDVFSITYADEPFTNDDAKVVPAKKIKYIEVIRPAGREWVDYVAAFGWGG